MVLNNCDQEGIMVPLFFFSVIKLHKDQVNTKQFMGPISSLLCRGKKNKSLSERAID